MPRNLTPVRAAVLAVVVDRGELGTTADHWSMAGPPFRGERAAFATHLRALSTTGHVFSYQAEAPGLSEQKERRYKPTTSGTSALAEHRDAASRDQRRAPQQGQPACGEAAASATPDPRAHIVNEIETFKARVRTYNATCDLVRTGRELIGATPADSSLVETARLAVVEAMEKAQAAGATEADLDVALTQANAESPPPPETTTPTEERITMPDNRAVHVAERIARAQDMLSRLGQRDAYEPHYATEKLADATQAAMEALLVLGSTTPEDLHRLVDRASQSAPTGRAGGTSDG